MEEQEVIFICLGTTENFQGSYKIFSLKTEQVVKREQKIREIPMPTWDIQTVEVISMCDGQDISNGIEPLLIDHFSNENDFAAALHECSIAGLAQAGDGQDNDNEDDNSNTNEDPDELPGISLEPVAARG